MTNDELRELMATIERLERLQDAEPSRRLLVALDAVLSQLEKFRARVAADIAAGSTDPELTTWSKEAEELAESVRAERLRVSKLITQELN